MEEAGLWRIGSWCLGLARSIRCRLLQSKRWHEGYFKTPVLKADTLSLTDRLPVMNWSSGQSRLLRRGKPLVLRKMCWKSAIRVVCCAQFDRYCVYRPARIWPRVVWIPAICTPTLWSSYERSGGLLRWISAGFLWYPWNSGAVPGRKTAPAMTMAEHYWSSELIQVFLFLWVCWCSACVSQEAAQSEQNKIVYWHGLVPSFYRYAIAFWFDIFAALQSKLPECTGLSL